MMFAAHPYHTYIVLCTAVVITFQFNQMNTLFSVVLSGSYYEASCLVGRWQRSPSGEPGAGSYSRL